MSPHPRGSEITVKNSKKPKLNPMGQTGGAPNISGDGNAITQSCESIPTTPPGESSMLQTSVIEELVKLMIEHDEKNRRREIRSRYFYAPWWGLPWVTRLSPRDDC